MDWSGAAIGMSHIPPEVKLTRKARRLEGTA